MKYPLYQVDAFTNHLPRCWGSHRAEQKAQTQQADGDGHQDAKTGRRQAEQEPFSDERAGQDAADGQGNEAPQLGQARAGAVQVDGRPRQVNEHADERRRGHKDRRGEVKSRQGGGPQPALIANRAAEKAR